MGTTSASISVIGWSLSAQIKRAGLVILSLTIVLSFRSPEIYHFLGKDCFVEASGIESTTRLREKPPLNQPQCEIGSSSSNT